MYSKQRELRRLQRQCREQLSKAEIGADRLDEAGVFSFYNTSLETGWMRSGTTIYTSPRASCSEDKQIEAFSAGVADGGSRSCLAGERIAWATSSSWRCAVLGRGSERRRQRV
jgi:hypothetical protein